MTTEALKRAYASTAQVLGNVTSEELASSTPCASWDVRALVNHVVGTPYYFASAVEAGEGPSDETETDFAGSDFRASFADGTKLATAAFETDGAMDKTIMLPFGEVPGSMVVRIAAVDTFVHGWDLAKATGQSTDLDAELAEELLGAAKAHIPDGVRGDEPAPFAFPVDVPTSAPAADRLAGFSVGRPSWGGGIDVA